jgi:hypothetical protein
MKLAAAEASANGLLGHRPTELQRLVGNFTAARPKRNSRDHSRQNDRTLHTLHGQLS